MNIVEELSCDGVAPSGPVSAWPQDRHEKLMDQTVVKEKPKKATKVNASISKMATGLFRTASQAVANGRVSEEIRNERYNTCKSCPFFIEDSKRCSECGCFMEAKTWIGGDPDSLCPKKKWSR